MTGPSHCGPAKALYDAYREWAKGNGDEPITVTAFGRRLEESGYEYKKTSKGRIRQGIALKSSFVTDDEDEEVDDLPQTGASCAGYAGFDPVFVNFP